MLDGEFMDVRCATHIIYLVVYNGLRKIHDSIVGISNVVRYDRSSPSRYQIFKDCIEK